MMKKIFKTVFIALVVSGGIVSAQVGINTTTPAPGSILDIESTDKAVVLPRVSINNLNTIAPVTGGAEEGMVVYNINDATRKGIKFWDGMRWQGTTEMIIQEFFGNQGNQGPGTSGMNFQSQGPAGDRGRTRQVQIFSTSFVLTKTTLVEIIFQTDVVLFQRNLNMGMPVAISDGQARLYGGRIILDSGGVRRNLITDSHSYSNISGAAFPFGGVFYVRGSAFVELPAGTHDIEYVLFVGGGSDEGTRMIHSDNPAASYVQVILHN